LAKARRIALPLLQRRNAGSADVPIDSYSTPYADRLAPDSLRRLIVPNQRPNRSVTEQPPAVTSFVAFHRGSGGRTDNCGTGLPLARQT